MIWGLIVVALLAFLFLGLYNSLVRMRQLVRNAWADVDVYLKRRSELIPNLVAAVKGYASHEQAVLTAVSEARAHAQSLKGPTLDHAAAEQNLGSAIVNVFAVAESYPELKASANFQDLQKELKDTERLIANARQYFNACVRDFNVKIEAFPSNLVAGTMGLKQQDFFELDDVSERAVPGVS